MNYVKKEVSNIITGKYKNYHRAWLFFLVLIVYFFSPIPTLAFSDNFNSYSGTYNPGSYIGSWYVYSGSWSFQSSNPFDNSQYVTETSGASTDFLKLSVASNINYTEVEFNGSGTADIVYAFKATSTTAKAGFDYDSDAGILQSAYSAGYGFNYNPVTVSPKYQWLKLITTITNGQLNIKLYAQNGSLINEQNSAYSDPLPSTLILLGVATSGTGYFDNVVASASSPSSPTSISWGKSSYTAGDTLSFSWNIKDSDWNCGFGCNSFISITKDGEPYSVFERTVGICPICTTSISHSDQVPQVGTYYFVSAMSDTGKYNATLYNGIGTGFYSVTENDIAIASTSVTAQSPAYLAAPPQVAARIPFTVTYNFGAGGIITPRIVVYYLGTQIESQTQINPLSMPSGTINVTVNNAGSYTLRLQDIYTGITYKSALITSVFSAPPATLNITNSSVSIDKSVYNWHDLIVGKYAIDNINYTAGITYLDVYNYDIQGVTTEDYSFNVGCPSGSCQIGNFMEQITPYKPATLTTAKILYVAGNNSIRLMLKYSNGTSVILAYSNFTLSAVNAAGYGLKLSKNDVVENEVFFASITIPENNVALQIRNLAGGAVIYTAQLNYSNVAISKSLSIAKAGAYGVVLINSLGIDEMEAPVNVFKVVTPTPTGNGGGATEKTTEVTNLLSSNIFWALLMVAGMMIFIAHETRKKS